MPALTLTTVLGLLLVLGSACVMLFQWIALREVKRTGKSTSVVPFLGSILGAAGLIAIGAPFRNWWWVPLVLDPGGPFILGLAFLHYRLSRRAAKKK